eukprot:s2340_g1.t1
MQIGIMLQTLTARLISLDARISDVVQEQDHRASCYVRAVARLRAKGDSDADPQSLKVARKLAHLYNEEARVALAGGDQNEKAEDLLQQAILFWGFADPKGFF